MALQRLPRAITGAPRWRRASINAVLVELTCALARSAAPATTLIDNTLVVCILASQYEEISLQDSAWRTENVRLPDDQSAGDDGRLHTQSPPRQSECAAAPPCA
jgi:hypothetical protein